MKLAHNKRGVLLGAYTLIVLVGQWGGWGLSGCVLSSKLCKRLVQSLKKDGDLVTAHSDGGSSSEVGARICVRVRAPVVKGMGTDGYILTWNNDPVRF